ncbi:Fructose-1,6-bisphosphatase, cytosolic [Hibiscus syriacus]|uniref:Fructose-1,6-bisphosphatase, cytosolic n=1 Tax=Hibiscus syriacus TaxID=106335 RepID=A0A6A3BIS0_HIBSY|nr:Fructose-1,6-bisphosphatase, cytosolic [Hibiscus syriacus]
MPPFRFFLPTTISKSINAFGASALWRQASRPPIPRRSPDVLPCHLRYLTSFADVTHCFIGVLTARAASTTSPPSLLEAIEKAKGAKSWGIVLGTLGRQGNPRVLERLEEIALGDIRMVGERWLWFLWKWIELQGELSIDWGDAFVTPLLTTFEAEIALGEISGWWERDGCGSCGNGLSCKESKSCCDGNGVKDFRGDYPMDYYAQDGGEWNSSYVKKSARPVRRNVAPPSGNGALI